MSKKVATIILIPLIILGSFITFYMTNLVLSDVSNLFYGISNRPSGIFATLPGINLSFIFVLATVFIVRILRHKEYFKSMCKLYMIIAMAFSAVGLVSAILAAIVVYQDLFAPNPYPGYLFTLILFYVLIIAFGVVFFTVIYKKMKGSDEKRKISFGYVMYSIVFAITAFYSFNRFGALMWSFTYIDLPTFYYTWPFYVSLILPLAMFVHSILYAFNFYKKYNGLALIIISLISLLFVISTLYTLLMGYYNPVFISVISPAMGASRLLAKPIDIIAHTLVFGGLDIYALQHSISYFIKHKKD